MAKKNNIKIGFVASENTGEIETISMSGFHITRTINGEKVDIELTGGEIAQAFCFQEHIYYVSDIESVLEELEEDGDLYGYTADEIIADKELMGSIVSAYEKNRDKYDMEWHYAASEAIKNKLEEKGEKQND